VGSFIAYQIYYLIPDIKKNGLRVVLLPAGEFMCKYQHLHE
jgi:hypothetical protein